MKSFIKYALLALLVLGEIAVSVLLAALAARETDSHIVLVIVLYITYKTIEKITGLNESPETTTNGK